MSVPPAPSASGQVSAEGMLMTLTKNHPTPSQFLTPCPLRLCGNSIPSVLSTSLCALDASEAGLTVKRNLATPSDEESSRPKYRTTLFPTRFSIIG